MAPSDQDLITFAQKGDMSAFEQLVFRYDKHVLAIANRFGNGADDAKDIYQEVFLRVYRGLKNFRGQSEFMTWLYRITTNVCLTHRSNRKKNLHVPYDREMDDDHPGMTLANNARAGSALPDQQAMSSEISSKVERALQTLSPQQKLVFTMRHYEGYKLREIAGMMNCTEGTVKRYLFAGTQRMREQLREFYES